MRNIDLLELFPYVLFAFFIIFIIVLATNTNGDTRSYEYETIDGEKGIAAYCGAPTRVPYCRLDDGTMVYGIKQYKKIVEEEE